MTSITHGDLAPRINSLSPRLHREHFFDIDCAKVAAIVLVVLGHVPDERSPEWAKLLRYFIYNFHMPFFMYLSGYVFFNSVSRKSQIGLVHYTLSRANRLLVPFVFFSALSINIKYLASGIGHLNRSNFDYLDGYKYLIVQTSRSPALDLWYLAVLFIVSVISRPFMQPGKKYLGLLFFVSLGMYAVFAAHEPTGGMIDVLYVDRVCWFYVFFVIGAIFSAYRSITSDFMTKMWLPSLILLLLYEYLALNHHATFGSGWRFFACGVLSIISIHGAILRLTLPGPLISRMSQNVMIVYLLNTILVAALLQAAHSVSLLDQTPYALQLAVITALGLAVPILLRSILLRIPRLAHVTAYIS